MELIYGAGGHGRVLLDTLRALGREPDGFIDDGKAGTSVDGLPVHAATVLDGGEVRVGYLGVGHNPARERIAARLLDCGVRLPTVVHPRAWISPFATLGEGAVAYAGVCVNTGAVIGRGVILNTGAVVDHDAHVGDFAHISPNAALGGAAGLGARSWAGLGSSIIHLVQVGDDTILGAGATAVRDLPSNVVAVGVPARVIRENQVNPRPGC